MDAVYWGISSGRRCQREGWDVDETVREPGGKLGGVPEGRFSNRKMFGIDRKTER